MTAPRRPLFAAWLAPVLATAIFGGCFSAEVVEDLPCSRDETCGPDLVCAFGYCRPPGFDALAQCGDGQPAQGEFCYPAEASLEVAFAGALRELAWADFDANGFVDALTLSETATVHLNDGARGFMSIDIDIELTLDDLRALGFDIAPAVEFPITVLPRHLGVADYAGDSLPDAILVLEFRAEGGPDIGQELLDMLGEPLWLAENQGEGNITLRPLPSTAPFGGAAVLSRGLVPGDYDGDGRADLLVVAEAFGGEVRADVLFGDPEATLANAVQVPLGAPAVPISGDLDGDGTDDLVVPNTEMGTVSVVHGPFGGGSVPVPELVGVDEPPIVVHLDDLDGDDRLDVLVGFSGDDTGFQPLLRDTDGELAAGTAVLTEGIGTVSSVATADLDADGNLDVVTVSNEGLFVHPGYGGGSFGGGFLLDDIAAGFVAVFTMDDDAAPDIVTGSSNLAVLFFGDP